MKAAIVSTWSGPKTGREQQALEVFASFQEFWEKRIHEGTFTRREVYFEQSGRGMSVAHGDQRDLVDVMESDEYVDLISRANLTVADLEIKVMITEDGIERLLTSYVNAGRSLGML